MDIISVVVILVILLCGVLGFKKGVIKTGVQLVGTICVLIIAYALKDSVANLLMKYLPFFNFGGIFEGITAINILMYEMISFIVIFILLYCILNILLTLSGAVEKILKFTIVLAIPSKILGFILGLMEGIIFTYMVLFVFLHLPQTENMVMDSKVALVVLERTPFIGSVALRTTLALEQINDTVKDLDENSNRDEANFNVIHTLIYYKIVSQEEVEDLMNSGKLKVGLEMIV